VPKLQIVKQTNGYIIGQRGRTQKGGDGKYFIDSESGCVHFASGPNVFH
jgi:hypothetical protein